MRIPDSNNSESLLSNLQRLTSRQSTLQNQVSSGQRITLPSDDPAAAGRVLKMQAEKLRVQQYADNAAKALEVNQTSYSSIEGLKSISDRAGELGTLGVGINDPTGMKAYGTELNQLIEQGLQNANSQYGGVYIFGGTATDNPPFTATRDAAGKITGVAYSGASSGASVNIGENATISPYTNSQTNQQIGDFLNNLVAMRDALSSGSVDAVQAAQPGLQTSEDNILNTVSDIGTVQTRLEASTAQNTARFSELEKLTSKDADADITDTIVKLTQTQTAYQAALQVGAQVMRTSLIDYLN
jgi:flagellar hook-associated protein 3 FlgL